MMNKTVKTGADFLEKSTPKDGHSPSKKEIFDALFEARGTEICLNDENGKEVSIDKYIEDKIKDAGTAENAKLTIGMSAGRSKIRIITNSPELQDRDFVNVSLSSFVKAGGKLEDFAKDMDTYKKQYKAEKGNALSSFVSRQAMQEVRA